MSFDWKALAARIDDMSLRERAMLFASVSLVVLLLAYVALLDPVLRKQKSLIDRVTRDQNQITEIRVQIERAVKGGDGKAQHPGQAAIDTLKRQIADLDSALAARQSVLIAPERLPALLKDILGRSKAVELESLRLLPGVPVRAGAGETSLYRHGVELSVKGSYFALLEYLEELEKRGPALLWGTVELRVEQYPEVRLRVVLHSLSRSASLLSI
ncbi:MAG: type II secretion system protein GspM [Betaproteobacteria bacterium]